MLMVVNTSFCKSINATFNVVVGKNCLSSFCITSKEPTTPCDNETNLSIYNSIFQSPSHSRLSVEFIKGKIYTEIKTPVTKE